ncbi:hypothetical protein HCA37_04445 [Listeria seeligeri]|uniref:hypothetical protein n=1 Tax=Listeria seeligeri TaxID=1640 RepID=UPI0016245CE6|nr:hypothetical protein [Listeria seeligeri]MBC1479461.1 hypothetical protein [Listeria seeligeri]MBC1789563.1 hypothetical protein [Listeria seeligeri]MBC1846144.1 hypothetical protein [Listeria seeligeri]
MRGRNLMKVIGMTVIATTLVLTGCGNEETKKKDTEKQTKTVKEQDKKVKIESNEGKPQHEQLITVNKPPEMKYLNDETIDIYKQDEKKYDNTVQAITDDSITLLLGEYCFYDSAMDTVKCSVIVVNGTNTTIEELSFQASIEVKTQPNKTFEDDFTYEFIEVETGVLQPNKGFPAILGFLEKNPLEDDGDKMIKLNSQDITIQLKNIQYNAVE